MLPHNGSKRRTHWFQRMAMAQSRSNHQKANRPNELNNNASPRLLQQVNLFLLAHDVYRAQVRPPLQIPRQHLPRFERTPPPPGVKMGEKKKKWRPVIGFGVFDKSKVQSSGNESTCPSSTKIAQMQTHGGIARPILTCSVALHARYALPDKCLARAASPASTYGAGPSRYPAGNFISVARSLSSVLRLWHLGD